MKENRTETTISAGARSWCDLPPELLREIANSLGLIDLLRFRGVCKEWRSASFTASAPIESAPDTKPCFLLHDDNDEKTTLFNPTTNETYTIIDIPEFKESTCLASSNGWLLLYQKESGFIFFFCPFSRAKIDLPQIQESEISKGVAVFTSPPSSIDCVTGMLYRKDAGTLELYVLQRVVLSWTKYEYKSRTFGDVMGATFVDGCFNFLDDKDILLTFSMEDKRFTEYTIVKDCKDPNVETLRFNYREKYFRLSDLKKRMELGNDVTITTCAASYFGSQHEIVIKSENIEAMGGGSRPQRFKGIWIQPRFFQLPPNYTW